MKPELVVMLTCNDQTVENAIGLFDQLKDTPIIYWGFKDAGLPSDKMKQLVADMKAAGKTTNLEVVSLSEKEGMEAARKRLKSDSEKGRYASDEAETDKGQFLKKGGKVGSASKRADGIAQRGKTRGMMR